MLISYYMMNAISLAGIVVLTSLGAGIGGGIASRAALLSLSRAPSTRISLMRALIIGLALLETGAIIGVVMALMLMNKKITVDNEMMLGTASCAIMLALGISGLVIGIVSASGIVQGLYAITRQPFFSAKIINMMLLTQSLMQTPIIFAFFISFAIYVRMGSLHSMVDGLRMIAAGACIGFGSIGPTIGLSRFAQAALQAIAINRTIYRKLLPFSFISQAIIETPLIFALLTAMLILFIGGAAIGTYTSAIACFAAAGVIGLGTLSPGLSSGKVAAAACLQMAHNPVSITAVSRVSVLVQGLIDTCAIYALVIAIMCLLI